MSCLGKFNNDKTCDRCSLSTPTLYQDCKEITDKLNQLQLIISSFEFSCVFRKEQYDMDEKDYINKCTYSGKPCKFGKDQSCIYLVMRHGKGQLDDDITLRL